MVLIVIIRCFFFKDFSNVIIGIIFLYLDSYYLFNLFKVYYSIYIFFIVCKFLDYFWFIII